MSRVNKLKNSQDSGPRHEPTCLPMKSEKPEKSEDAGRFHYKPPSRLPPSPKISTPATTNAVNLLILDTESQKYVSGV